MGFLQQCIACTSWAFSSCPAPLSKPRYWERICWWYCKTKETRLPPLKKMDSQKSPEMRCLHQTTMVGICLTGAGTVWGSGGSHYYENPLVRAMRNWLFQHSTNEDDENPDSEESDRRQLILRLVVNYIMLYYSPLLSCFHAIKFDAWDTTRYFFVFDLKLFFTV